MSAFLGLLGHRLANIPPALTANCTSLALGIPSSPSPPSSSPKQQASSAAQAAARHRGRPSSIAGTMLFVGTVGSAGAALFQLLSTRAILALLLGGAEPGARVYVREFLRSARGRAHLDATLSAAEVRTRGRMARDWRYRLFCVLFGVVAAGVPEEMLKYLPAVTVRWWRGRKAAKAKAKTATEAPASSGMMSSLEFVNYTVAAAIGFAIFENAGVIYGSVSGGVSATELLLLLAERTVSALPGHVLCAALSGIRGASTYRRRRPVNAAAERGGIVAGLLDALSAILPSVLYHGVFDSALLGISALGGHPGWVRPADPWVLAGGYGMVVAMQGSLALTVRAAWREEEAQALEEEEEGENKKKRQA